MLKILSLPKWKYSAILSGATIFWATSVYFSSLIYKDCIEEIPELTELTSEATDIDNLEGSETVQSDDIL